MKIAIVGAGKLGLKIISALVGGDHAITVFDTDETVLNKISQTYDVMTVAGNAKQISLLKDKNIGNCILCQEVRMFQSCCTSNRP